MRIANPIYDTIFKYLLDDEKVARLMLSALIGQEVLALQFRPTEHRTRKVADEGTNLLVLHLDFAATVRLEDGGQKRVLIEIQKARTAVDVLRFRAYLGCNYSDENNVHPGPDGQSQPLPILTICATHPRQSILGWETSSPPPQTSWPDTATASGWRWSLGRLERCCG